MDQWSALSYPELTNVFGDPPPVGRRTHGDEDLDLAAGQPLSVP
jgi:hypothetical protein